MWEYVRGEQRPYLISGADVDVFFLGRTPCRSHLKLAFVYAKRCDLRLEGLVRNSENCGRAARS